MNSHHSCGASNLVSNQGIVIQSGGQCNYKHSHPAVQAGHWQMHKMTPGQHKSQTHNRHDGHRQTHPDQGTAQNGCNFSHSSV